MNAASLHVEDVHRRMIHRADRVSRGQLSGSGGFSARWSTVEKGAFG